MNKSDDDSIEKIDLNEHIDNLKRSNDSGPTIQEASLETKWLSSKFRLTYILLRNEQT